MISVFEDHRGCWGMDFRKGQGNRGHRSQQIVQTKNVVRLPGPWWVVERGKSDGQCVWLLHNGMGVNAC